MRTEDGYIIQQCLDGDQTAYGLLVDKYKRSIYALAFSRVHNFHDAQDITQEVFTKAYQNLHTLRRWDNFLGWLYRIACNLCNDWIRSVSNRPDRDYIEDQESDDLDNVSINSYSVDMSYHSIKESLESLPEVYREVLSLRYFGGMTIGEISRFLGLSTRTIDRRLSEAMTKLKEETFTMMTSAREQHELPSSFTFRIVEIIKHIRVNPISPLKALPFGLTLAVGIIAGFLSINTHFNMTDAIGSLTSFLGDTKVLDVGEYPVDVVKVSSTPIISNQQMNGDGLGSTEPSLQNALFMAPQAEGGTWTKKADMLTERTNFSSSMANGKIYAMGGWKNGINIELAAVEEYDPKNNKWTEKANLLLGRQWFSASSVDGKIYVIGGWRDGTTISSVEEYNSIKDEWIKKADMPTARYWFSTSVVNGKIYAIGGSDGKKLVSTIEEYDLKTDTWSKKSDMPTLRANFSTGAINDKIYVIGGVVGENFSSTLVEEYDPANDKWTKRTDMPTERGWLPTCAPNVNNKIYVIGGVTGNNIIGTVEEYVSEASESINFKGKLPTTWGDVRIAKNR